MELIQTLLTTVAAPILVGLIVQFSIYVYLQRRERITRRRRILLLVSQCAEIVLDNALDGFTAKKWARPEGTDSLNRDSEYWRLGVEALALFEVKEQIVAEWLEIELLAGRDGYFYYLDDLKVPRRRRNAQEALNSLLSDGASSDDERDFGPPRASMLAEWAELRSPGPIYGSEGVAGDSSRHHIVPPNSDVVVPRRQSPVHEFAPQGSWFRGKWTAKRLERFRAKLQKKSSKRWARDRGGSLMTRALNGIGQAIGRG
jgi:hypothetical protein